MTFDEWWYDYKVKYGIRGAPGFGGIARAAWDAALANLPEERPSDRDILMRFQKWTITLDEKGARDFWDDIAWLSGCGMNNELAPGNGREKSRAVGVPQGSADAAPDAGSPPQSEQP